MGYMTIKGKKTPSKRSRKNDWNYSLQKIYRLSFFSLLLIIPCPVCSLHLSFQWERYSCSVASLKLRVFLQCLPKRMYQLTQLIIWKRLCMSQPQLCELSAEWCSLLPSSAKPALSQWSAAEWWSGCRLPAAAFPKSCCFTLPFWHSKCGGCSTLIPSAWSKTKPLQPLLLNND